MADVLFGPHGPVTVPIARGGLFAVRRVYCVGRNYAEHAAEMGHDTREPPFFFGKPADALVTGGADIPYPSQTADFHHEIELVVAIGKDGSDIAPAEALVHARALAEDPELAWVVAPALAVMGAAPLVYRAYPRELDPAALRAWRLAAGALLAKQAEVKLAA